MPYDISDDRRAEYRATSARSRQRKLDLLAGSPASRLPDGDRLDPDLLMPQQPPNHLSCLSLFSGGGGLDLGFERAGFQHRASLEIRDICGATLRANRPQWDARSGDRGDVTRADFAEFCGVQVVHGGPPCQPFSVAGRQAGAEDPRNMWGEFTRCVLQVVPRAFVAENVVGILGRKFEDFVRDRITGLLGVRYRVRHFQLAAHDFGVPQARRRVFFVGFLNPADAERFSVPDQTHGEDPLLPRNLTRHSLGLPDTGFDAVCPTLRSGFTGTRNSTGVLSSRAALRAWADLRLWPSGVQKSREMAAAYPPENGHSRLSVQDCALLQGFPEEWKFCGAVYQVLGQIGNSVCPPVAYALARQLALALA